MNMHRAQNDLAGCCALGAVVLAVMLIAAYAFIFPVEVTVDEAALWRLDLAAPAGSGTGNGTGTATSLVAAFNLTFAVAVRNPNWAMSAWRAAPLFGELSFRGAPLAWGRLPGAWRRRIRARRAEVLRVSSAAEGVPVALGGDAVAEFARESAAGSFELQLVVAGKVRYQAHIGRRRFRASCPLKLALTTAAATPAFARVKCTY